MLNKIKTFGRTFINSLTKPVYYADILKAKFSFSFKYLVLLILSVSLLFGIGIAARVIRLIPQVPTFLEKGKTAVVAAYPKELKLTVKDQKLSDNVKEPYFIDLPSQATASAQTYAHFLTLNTKGKAEEITTLGSTFLITADSLVISDGTTYRVVPLTEVLNKIPDGFSLTKDNLGPLLGTAQPYLAKVLPRFLVAASLLVLIFYPLLRTLFVGISNLVILLPITLVLFLFAKIFKKSLSFGKTYQLAMHGLTLPITVTFLVGSFAFYGIVSFIAWLGFFVFMGFVITKLPLSKIKTLKKSS